jgi:hypothetical protein
MQKRAILLFLALTGLAGAADRDQFHWRGHVLAGKFIEVKGVNGSIRAVPGAGPDAEVIAVKTGLREAGGAVHVEVIEGEAGLVVCAVYPGANQSSTACKQPAPVESSAVRVDFIVRVPKGVRFIARTVNGAVDVLALKSDVAAYTVNGNVNLSTAGKGEAETVNGSIIASVGSTAGNASGPSRLHFSTVNGTITLAMPARANAQIQASTVNGRITSDFPLPIRGRFAARRADGKIGSGGPQVSLRTVNGSIALRQANRSI